LHQSFFVPGPELPQVSILTTFYDATIRRPSTVFVLFIRIFTRNWGDKKELTHKSW